MAYLKFKGNNSTVPVDKDTFTIGRHGDFKSAYYPANISRLHCALFRNGDTHSVRDLNSHTGTSVNGTGIGNGERVLQDGDSIQVGNLTIEYSRKGT